MLSKSAALPYTEDTGHWVSQDLLGAATHDLGFMCDFVHDSY